MTKLSEYQGKLAMVTGAGDGIGEMLAKQLAEKNAIALLSPQLKLVHQ